MATWRVLTWNVRGAARPDLRAIAEAIESYRPDVVALQEVRRGQSRRLARVLGWHQTWCRKHFPLTPAVWWWAEGLALLSPHDLADVHHESLSPDVSSWTHRHRVMLAATVDRFDGSSLRVIDLHLATGPEPAERVAQSERVARYVGGPAGRTVVTGDLNAPDEPAVLRALLALGLRDPGGAPTNPSHEPRQRIDYVLVPGAATVTEQDQPRGGPPWHRLSDHLPVLVAFDLP